MTHAPRTRHRAVVVGGGFGGLAATLHLARRPIDVTLVDRRNFHLFQPLAYQVATGALSPAEICYPLRRVFRSRRNVRVVLGEVVGIDLAARAVELRAVGDEPPPGTLAYDSLIVAGGSHYTYFGHDEWRQFATDLKTLEGALTIRRRVLAAFEAAELEPDLERRAAWLTFVVVGGGPTGVEMAGQIAEIARDLRGEFRSLDASGARVLLLDAGDRVLKEFPAPLSAKALRSLSRLGVTTRLQHPVVDVDARAVTVRRADGSLDAIPSRTVVWAGGVVASCLARVLAEGAGLEVDAAGRVPVEADLSLRGHPEVLAVGDMARTPSTVPGLAPVAMQQGRHAARVVDDRRRGRPSRPFRYRDKGNLATIGRARAVAEVKGIHLSGFLAWIIWLIVHLRYLIGFENRLVVLIRWGYSFLVHGRSARLITHAPEPQRSGAA